MSLGNLGWLRLQQGNLDLARRLLEQSRQHLEALLAPNLVHAGYLEAYRNQNYDFATALVRQGDHAAAAEGAAAVPERIPARQGLILAAEFLACCAATAETSANTSEPDSRALAQRYAAGDVELLR
jgi:hypothetical protein